MTSEPVFNIYSASLTPTPTEKSNATYILALTDPDATSRADPVKAQMCHWIATNITLPVSQSVVIESSDSSPLASKNAKLGSNGIDELVSYFPPTPPPKTGYHRYVFVVLAYDTAVSGAKLQKPKDRPHWGYAKVGAGVREWADENNLVVVG